MWADEAAPGADETSAAGDETSAAGDETPDDLDSISRAGSRAAESDPDAAGQARPLPTYEAFAAKSEARERLSAVTSLPTARRADGAGAGRDSSDTAGARAGYSAGFADDELDEEPAETLDEARARAENISMHALSRRGVSSSEMAKTLRSRDLPDEIVEEEIARLEGVGLLNDAELAENLVRTKQDRKGLGKGAITAELRQRGLAQEAIEAAVDEIDDDEEQSRADEWARKRAGQLRGLDQATAERRLNGYLMRRGYRSEVIRRAVEKALPRGGSSRGGVRFE